MRNDNQTCTYLFRLLTQQRYHPVRIFIVEVRSWLVGQNNVGVVHHGAGNANPLLLSLTELMGFLRQLITKT